MWYRGRDTWGAEGETPQAHFRHGTKGEAWLWRGEIYGCIAFTAIDKSPPEPQPPSRGHAHVARTASMHASRAVPERPVRMKQVEGQRETRFLQRSLLDAGPSPLPLLPLWSLTISSLTLSMPAPSCGKCDAVNAMRQMRSLRLMRC